jgi:transketolase
VGAGLSYGQLGISHHATEDISIMRSLPNLSIFSPGDDIEVVGCTNQMIDQEGTAYIRLDRESAGCIDTATEPYSPGETRRISKGQRVAIISTGGMLSVALEVEKKLKSRELTATILSVPVISPFAEEKLIEIATTHQYLYTLEEHSIHGGLGGLVAETVLEANIPNPYFYRFGLRDGFSSVVGDQQYLRTHYKIDAVAIADRILADIESSKKAV